MKKKNSKKLGPQFLRIDKSYQDNEIKPNELSYNNRFGYVCGDKIIIICNFKQLTSFMKQLLPK